MNFKKKIFLKNVIIPYCDGFIIHMYKACHRNRRQLDIAATMLCQRWTQ